jgi:hypothetical protein
MMQVMYKYNAEMNSGGIVYKTSFMTIGSGIPVILMVLKQFERFNIGTTYKYYRDLTKYANDVLHIQRFVNIGTTFQDTTWFVPEI